MVKKSMGITEEQWALVNIENRNMVKDFLEQSTQLSTYTLNQYKSALEIYFWFIKENCEDKAFYDIRSRDFLKFQNWLVNRGLSSSAIKLKRSVVSSFNGYILLYYEDEYPDFKNYISKKIPNPPSAFVNAKEPLNLDEYKILCEKLEEKELWQQLAYLKFSFSTSARRNEVRQLLKSVIISEPLIKDVESRDKNGNKIILQSKSYLTEDVRCKGRGKIGKIRKLQFDQSAMDAIKKWLDIRGEDDCPYVFVSIRGEKVSQARVEIFNYWCTNILEPIVGRRVHPHLLRESRATTLVVEQGKDISVAQKLLGHNSSQTTEIYIIRKDTNASDGAFTDG